jgi:hypothetical protein
MKRLGWSAVGAAVGGSALWAFSRFGKRAVASRKNAPPAESLEEGETAPSTAEEPGGPNPEFRQLR